MGLPASSHAPKPTIGIWLPFNSVGIRLFNQLARSGESRGIRLAYGIKLPALGKDRIPSHNRLLNVRQVWQSYLRRMKSRFGFDLSSVEGCSGRNTAPRTGHRCR